MRQQNDDKMLCTLRFTRVRSYFPLNYDEKMMCTVVVGRIYSLRCKEIETMKNVRHAGGRPTKGGEKTTPHSILLRVVKVSELYLTGMSMMAIAKQLKVSHGTVYRDLQIAHEQWRTNAAENIEKLKQNELSHVDWVEMEATKAWHRSVGIHKKTISKVGTAAPNGPYQEEVEHAEELAGDPRFLDVINKSIDQRCKIMGLIAPIKSTVSNPDGSPLLSGIKVVEVGGTTQGTK